MRNIFDQYTQPENRITHALVCCLSEDPKLLNHFIMWATGKAQKVKNLEIVEQRLPGEPENTEDESEKRGLPDAWIFNDESWSLIIESKIAATLTLDQLKRHYNTALRRGYSDALVLALDVVAPKNKLPAWAKFIYWSDVYSWLKANSTDSMWACKAAEYMEVAEIRFTESGYLKEGTLTTFSGIPFCEKYPYNYPEAKRILKLAIGQLRENSNLEKQLGIDLKAEGRPAITGADQTAVWDFLSLKSANNEDNFTSYPHFTISIKNDHVYVLVTMPNGIKREYRHNLFDEGFEKFENIIQKVASNFEKITSKIEGAVPWVEVVQRHYKSQRSAPSIDARLAFDLRTAFPGKDTSIKNQPLWLQATFDTVSKRKVNTQLAVGIVFNYSSCDALRSADIIKVFANTWIACKPFVLGMLNQK